MTQFWKIQEHLVLMIARFRKTKLDNYDAVQRMTADENAKKARTDDAKSLKALKERKEQLKQDKAALEKGRLKREKQSESDEDDESVAQQGEKPTVDKDAICNQSSSSGGNNHSSMNRCSWRCPTCTLTNDPATSCYVTRDTLRSSSGFDMMDHEDGSNSQNENNDYEKDIMDSNNNKHQSQPRNANAYSNQSK
ncbi:hypothetical protein RFI_34434 [Reticulomyxa filosa]|uniref:RanBP2-type domain-containing protein n=1 Tax=Reticulomyxa filosa TaxID=46433 RepID=X6LNN8_RETFI|nr:hypothetical protein RFI_34434 [Reticulomyxa filosa]|eukprot:ETO02976.1 hypothetical protein RFI_34434 [Reticulomyxa filosa]